MDQERATDGATALMVAVGAGHLEVVQWLATEGGAKVDQASKFRCTALMVACRAGHLDVLRWLAGPDQQHALQMARASLAAACWRMPVPNYCDGLPNYESEPDRVAQLQMWDDQRNAGSNSRNPKHAKHKQMNPE